jgi:hypothetical protein
MIQRCLSDFAWVGLWAVCFALTWMLHGPSFAHPQRFVDGPEEDHGVRLLSVCVTAVQSDLSSHATRTRQHQLSYAPTSAAR